MTWGSNMMPSVATGGYPLLLMTFEVLTGLWRAKATKNVCAGERARLRSQTQLARRR